MPNLLREPDKVRPARPRCAHAGKAIEQFVHLQQYCKNSKSPLSLMYFHYLRHPTQLVARLLRRLPGRSPNYFAYHLASPIYYSNFYCLPSYRTRSSAARLMFYQHIGTKHTRLAARPALVG